MDGVYKWAIKINITTASWSTFWPINEIVWVWMKSDHDLAVFHLRNCALLHD